MAQTNIPFQVKMGAEKDSSGASKLPSFKQGSLIITTDTKKVYVDPIEGEERIAVGGQQADSELSETSENPVQNKVITNAMVGKKIGTAEIFNNYENNVAYFEGIKVTSFTSGSYTLTLESVDGLIVGDTFDYYSTYMAGLAYSTDVKIASIDTATKTITCESAVSGPPPTIADAYVINISNKNVSNTVKVGVPYAHAEGNSTKAIGAYSHAEGNNTTASGQYSHAEGNSTKAFGVYSHAEGNGTTARGSYSHAQNYATTAGQENQTAMGKYNNNKTNTLLEVGNGTSYTACSNAFEVYSDGHAEVQTQGTTDNSVVIKSHLDNVLPKNTNLLNDAATASVKQLQDSSYTSIKSKTKNPNAAALDTTITDSETIGSLGNYSASFGGNTQAKGKRAFAVGTGTLARGNYTFASGSDSVALGSASHVEGYKNTTGPNADSAHAEGGENIVTSNRGHAEGYSNTISGEDSHAEGANNTVSGTQAHAEGLGNKATGNYSHAEGQNTEATGNQSHTEGARTKAIGAVSHVEGDTNEGQSYAAHIEGSGNKVLTAINSSDTPGTGTSGTGGDPSDPNFDITKHLGANSHVEGTRNLMYGYSAHAEGGTNNVTGHYAHAEGTNNTVSGNSAHAEGHENIVSTIYSHAEGTNNTINGNASQSHAEGNGNTVTGATAHAEGMNNKALADNTHVEGGSNIASGSSAHAEGSNTTASGSNSHAQNASTTASGNNSTAIGYKTVAQSEESFAGGAGTVVKGNYSFAFGTNNLIDSGAQNSVAFGINNTINNLHNDSVVFGYENKTSASGQFILGRYADSTSIVNKKPIFLVGNGTSDTRRSNAFEIYQDGHAEIQTVGSANNSVVTKNYVDSTINTKLSTVYKTQGSTTFANLPTTLTSAQEGFVYNISEEFTTTALFIEGAGKTYPSGTNVVVVKVDSAYKYDVLAGMVDLSSYVTNEKLTSALMNKQDNLYLTATKLNSSIVDITSNTNTLIVNKLHISDYSSAQGPAVVLSLGDVTSGIEFESDDSISYFGSEIVNKKSLLNFITNGFSTEREHSLTITSYNGDIYLNDKNGLGCKIRRLYAGTEDTDAVNLSQLKTKQDILVSGNNIKTINGQSILGSGNITIEGSGSGSTVIVDDDLSDTSTNPVQNKIVTASLNSKQSNLNLVYDSNGKLVHDANVGSASPVIDFEMITANDIAKVDYVFSNGLGTGPGFKLTDDHVVLLPPSIDVNADAGNGVLTGILTLSTADSIYGVTDDNLQYQAANKLYVDDSIATLQAQLPTYTYDEDTKTLLVTLA